MVNDFDAANIMVHERGGKGDFKFGGRRLICGEFFEQ
jgi:hypothetical protein